MGTALRVLLLEDVPSDAELIAYELRQAGYELDWTRVETEAEYAAHLSESLDLVVADYTLPQFTAMGALQLLQDRGWDIPFVVVTGSVSEEAAIECMKQGASDYLLKDRLARLGPAVERALRAKQMRDEKRRAEGEIRKLYEIEREQHRSLQRSQAQLVQAEKMTALGRLVASITHEINNPLQAVQSALELADEELQGEARRDRLARYVGTADKEIKRLAGIVRRLRDFYRPAREGMQPTQVQSVLENVLELTGKQLQHSRIAVECEWAMTLPAVMGNADYLKQVFLNLVLNAIDAMSPVPDGTLTVRTALDQMSQSGHSIPAVRIEFADTGPGIPPEVQAHLFEPFVTTKPEGTGLGLSISYGLIEAHSGQITATSRAGAGTTFIILLPAFSEE